MIKKMICTECPRGCALSVDIENCQVVKVLGNQCPKGEKFVISENVNPKRILTSAVLGVGVDLKMIPVRTDHPIPKGKFQEAMASLKKIRIDKSVQIGDVIVSDFLGLGLNLIVTRDCFAKKIINSC